MVYTGRVLQTTDEKGMGRIYVYVPELDNDETINENKLAFPLLPKFFFVKPKVYEYVVVIPITDTDGNPISRTYIGPLISQPQNMWLNDDVTALAGLGLHDRIKRNPELSPNFNGTFAKDNETALYGRGNTDIIMGDSSVRIRCGARLETYDVNGKTLKFNSLNSAFVHMKYYDSAISISKIGWNDDKKKLDTLVGYAGSVATISAEEINLVSSSNIPGDNGENKSGSEMLDDNKIKSIIRDAHPIVYGDKLVEVLNIFREAIYNHVHDWGPSMAKDHPTPELIRLDEVNFGEMLSKNIRAM